MDSPLKWLVLFVAVVALGGSAIRYPDSIYQLYKTYVSPDPPPPAPPDMSDYIELKPVEESGDDAGTFERGGIAYVAGAQNVLGWDETEIMLHYTYEGSGEEDKQSETWAVKHGTKVKILDIQSGRAGRWYRVETMEQFRHRGWLRVGYLRASRPANAKDAKEWGAAMEAAEEKDKKAREEAARQQKLLEEARKRRQQVGG